MRIKGIYLFNSFSDDVGAQGAVSELVAKWVTYTYMDTSFCHSELGISQNSQESGEIPVQRLII